MSQAEFDETVGLLKRYVAQLHYVTDHQFPDGMIYDPAFDPSMASGNVFDNLRMKCIAESIDNILGVFDVLQERLGLPSGHEPRHRRFLSGKS
jgi:hypothetical protein